MAGSVKPENNASIVSKYHALGANRIDGEAETDEKPFKIVIPRFFDFTPLNPDVIDHQLSGRHQSVQIVAERGKIGRQVVGALLEAHKDAILAELVRSIDQERRSEQRLAASGRAADQGRSAGRQSTQRYVVEAGDSCRRFGQADRPGGSFNIGEPFLLFRSFGKERLSSELGCVGERNASR
jgi:uncharacterized protein YdbL (DUF1318 family)